MDRVRSLRRRLVLFAGAGAAFVALVALQGTGRTAVRTAEELAKTFPGFAPEKAKTITVSKKSTRDGKTTEESLRLDLAAPDSWIVSSAHGYPARLDRVKPMLDAIRNSRTILVKTSNEARFSNYAGPEGFLEVRVLGVGDEPLASFGIGKGDAEGAWDNSYVRRDTKAAKEIIAAKNLSTSAFSTGVAEWVEARLFSSLSNGDLTEILVDQREKSRQIAIVRGTKGEKDTEDPWNLTKPEAGKATLSAATNLLGAVTGLTLDDVVDAARGPEADAKYGFDKPEIVVTATGKSPKEGVLPPTFRLTVGKKAEGKTSESFYVRKDDDPFVFTVVGYKLQDFRAEPTTFLEKKPPEEKPGDKPGDKPVDGKTPDGAAMGDEPPAVPPVVPPTPPPAPPPPPAMTDDAPMGDAPPPAMGP